MSSSSSQDNEVVEREKTRQPSAVEPMAADTAAVSLCAGPSEADNTGHKVTEDEFTEESDDEMGSGVRGKALTPEVGKCFRQDCSVTLLRTVTATQCSEERRCRKSSAAVGFWGRLY
jgi:hypothetical protein